MQPREARPVGAGVRRNRLCEEKGLKPSEIGHRLEALDKYGEQWDEAQLEGS